MHASATDLSLSSMYYSLCFAKGFVIRACNRQQCTERELFLYDTTALAHGKNHRMYLGNWTCGEAMAMSDKTVTAVYIVICLTKIV